MNHRVLFGFQAFRVISQPEKQKDMTKEDFMEHHRAWCCSTMPEKAICGVSRIWVFSLMRRKGIATRLLDTVRYSLTLTHFVSKSYSIYFAVTLSSTPSLPSAAYLPYTQACWYSVSHDCECELFLHLPCLFMWPCEFCENYAHVHSYYIISVCTFVCKQ